MTVSEKDFVFCIENDDSPILITVPHGGLKNAAGSWLGSCFQKRLKSEQSEKNYIHGEKIVLGGDGQILHIVGDILKHYKATMIAGLLPREFVDYNRFVPEVAYVDPAIKPFYDAYHSSISRTIERLQRKWQHVTLLDFHGFGKQPMEGREFDIVLGTNGESSPRGIDRLFYDSLMGKCHIFSAGRDGLPEETDLYRGDTTNLFYHKKYGVDGVLVEIAPRFRSRTLPESLQDGIVLSKDIAIVLNSIE